MKASDAGIIRRRAIQLSMVTHTGLDFLLDLTLVELAEVYNSVVEEQNRRKR